MSNFNLELSLVKCKTKMWLFLSYKNVKIARFHKSAKISKSISFYFLNKIFKNVVINFIGLLCENLVWNKFSNQLKINCHTNYIFLHCNKISSSKSAVLDAFCFWHYLDIKCTQEIQWIQKMEILVIFSHINFPKQILNKFLSLHFNY